MGKSGKKWSSFMLIGHYKTKLSSKDRLALPSKFKKVLGTKLIITAGYEKALMIVKKDNWENLTANITNQKLTLEPARATDRFLLGSAFELELDSKGRFIVPKYLRNYADLKEEVVFIGVGNRVELWSQAKWLAYEQYLDKNIEGIGQKLSHYQDGKNNS